MRQYPARQSLSEHPLSLWEKARVRVRLKPNSSKPQALRTKFPLKRPLSLRERVGVRADPGARSVPYSASRHRLTAISAEAPGATVRTSSITRAVSMQSMPVQASSANWLRRAALSIQGFHSTAE